MTMLKKSTVELTQHIRVNNVNGFFERVEKTACLEPESFKNMEKNKIIETNRQNSMKIGMKILQKMQRKVRIEPKKCEHAHIKSNSTIF